MLCVTKNFVTKNLVIGAMLFFVCKITKFFPCIKTFPQKVNKYSHVLACVMPLKVCKCIKKHVTLTSLLRVTCCICKMDGVRKSCLVGVITPFLLQWGGWCMLSCMELVLKDECLTW